MIIVDASATAPMFLADETHSLMPAVEASFENGLVMVPQHWRLEILNLGMMAVRRRRLDFESLSEGLDSLVGYDVRIDTETSGRAWTQTRHLAAKHGLTSYDAAYLELAMRTGYALASFDREVRDAATAEGIALTS